MKLIIDGNNIFYACYHQSKVPQMVPHMLLNKVKKHVSELQPQSVHVAWDGGRAAFRQQLLGGEYKAGRTEITEARSLMAIALEGLNLLGVHNYQYDGVEADDVIYQIVMQSNEPCTVLSTDSDFYQLVDQKPGTIIYHHIKGEAITVEQPDYIKWKALMGDKTDAVPGIVGVGPKTASKIIEQGLDAYLAANPEHKAIFERNMMLMDFTQNPMNEQIAAQVKNNPKPVFDMQAFQAYCLKYGMKQIQGKLHTWVIPFYQRRGI